MPSARAWSSSSQGSDAPTLPSPRGGGKREWPSLPGAKLSQDEVQIWCARPEDLDPVAPELIATLSDDERERAASFQRPQDGGAFALRRGALRIILGRQLGIPPERIAFRYGPFGKPSLDPDLDWMGLAFNQANTDGLLVYAITAGRAVGIDVEMDKPVANLEALATQFLSRQDALAITALPPSSRRRSFYQAWTRQEAALKATGDGLTQAPLRFASERWRTESFEPQPGYVGAISASGSDWRVSRREWRPAAVEPALYTS
jgi:4'-phosphopantetheinyl transferase